MLRIQQKFPRAKAAAAGSLALIVGFFAAFSALNSVGLDMPGSQGQVLSSSNLREFKEETTPKDANGQQSTETASWRPQPWTAVTPDQAAQQDTTPVVTTPSTASDDVASEDTATGTMPIVTIPELPVVPEVIPPVLPSQPVEPDPPLINLLGIELL